MTQKMSFWEVVIGLEIHAQVTSKAKLFSSASTAFGAEPNTQVSFVDAGMPGMLPVINSVCVDQAIKTGIGFHGNVQALSVFDRKNYFYPDLPTGYQISQFERPIVLGGFLEIITESGDLKKINITRLHLEQDAGKSTHDLSPTKTFIDLNRAGIALMEIVTEPEIASAYEAQAFVKKMRSLLRYLGTCDGNMEEGSMRVDANVSLRRPGEPLGTRAEIKNINSIRFLGQAITYEIERQKKQLESGQAIVQETRLYDSVKGETRSLRSKENAQDYRYFPDPDLPPLRLSPERLERIRASMPELPDVKQNRFVQEFGLSIYDANLLVNEKETSTFYEQALEHLDDMKQGAKVLANWLIGEVFAFANKEAISLSASPVSPGELAELVNLIVNQTISGKMAKELFPKMWLKEGTAVFLIEKLGLRQVTDTNAIDEVINTVLEANFEKVAEYKLGKIQLFGFFVGQIMKQMQGNGNPSLINELLKKKLQ